MIPTRITKQQLENYLDRGYMIDEMKDISQSNYDDLARTAGIMRYKGGHVKVVRVGNKLYRIFKYT